MYKVVFIGQPGSGKTTIICNWLGLLKADIVGRSDVDAVSLLPTATGRTTVAEVHIRQCTEPSSHIRVEYLPVEQQETYIKEFCDDYYQRCAGLVPDVTDATAYTDEDRTSHDNARGKTADSPHLEIDRLIRNMVGLPLQPQSIPYPDPNRESQRQEIIGSVLRYGSTEDFCNEMVRRANLDNRQQRDFEIEHGDGFREELARLFRGLNNGNLETASIPKRIDIDISSQDINLHLPEYIDEVIDTIGLDESVRDDLRERLRNPSAICVLVDRLENPPSQPIRSLLESIPTDEREIVKRKTALFIKSNWDELGRVNGADGNAELGIEIKRQEIDRVVRMGNIPYDINNTLFEDPCGAYHVVSQSASMHRDLRQQPGRGVRSSIIDYDAEEAEEFRRRINVHLETIAGPLRLADIVSKSSALLRAVVIPQNAFPCIVSELHAIRHVLLSTVHPTNWKQPGMVERILRRIGERKRWLDGFVRQFDGLSRRHEVFVSLEPEAPSAAETVDGAVAEMSASANLFDHEPEETLAAVCEVDNACREWEMAKAATDASLAIRECLDIVRAIPGTTPNLAKRVVTLERDLIDWENEKKPLDSDLSAEVAEALKVRAESVKTDALELVRAMADRLFEKARLCLENEQLDEAIAMANRSLRWNASPDVVQGLIDQAEEAKRKKEDEIRRWQNDARNATQRFDDKSEEGPLLTIATDLRNALKELLLIGEWQDRDRARTCYGTVVDRLRIWELAKKHDSQRKNWRRQFVSQRKSLESKLRRESLPIEGPFRWDLVWEDGDKAFAKGDGPSSWEPQYRRSVKLAKDAGTKLEQFSGLLSEIRRNLSRRERLRSLLPPEETNDLSKVFLSSRDAATADFVAGRFQKSLNMLNDFAQEARKKTENLEQAVTDKYEHFLRRVKELAEQPAFDCASAAVRSSISGEPAAERDEVSSNGPKWPWIPLFEPTRRSFVSPVILVRALSNPEEAGRRYADLWRFMREMAEKWSSVSDLDVKDDPVFDEHRRQAIEATGRLLDGGDDPEGEDGSIVRDAVVWCYEQSGNRKECFSEKRRWKATRRTIEETICRHPDSDAVQCAERAAEEAEEQLRKGAYVQARDGFRRAGSYKDELVNLGKADRATDNRELAQKDRNEAKNSGAPDEDLEEGNSHFSSGEIAMRENRYNEAERQFSLARARWSGAALRADRERRQTENDCVGLVNRVLDRLPGLLKTTDNQRFAENVKAAAERLRGFRNQRNWRSAVNLLPTLRLIQKELDFRLNQPEWEKALTRCRECGLADQVQLLEKTLKAMKEGDVGGLSSPEEVLGEIHFALDDYWSGWVADWMERRPTGLLESDAWDELRAFIKSAPTMVKIPWNVPDRFKGHPFVQLFCREIKSNALDMKIEPERVLLVLESNQKNAIVEALRSPGNHCCPALDKLSELIPEARNDFHQESESRRWNHDERQ